MTENWFARAGLTVHERGETFTARIPLRWADLDAQGQVNNPVYFDYLQDARLDFLLEGGVPAMLSGVLAVGHTIQYRAPIRYSEAPVEVSIVLLERRHARFRVGYVIVHDGELCAVAASTMVPFDLESQRPRRLMADEVEYFDRFTWTLDSPFRELPRPTLHGRGHVSQVLTRFSDVDRQNHVNNVKTLEYFQEARRALAKRIDPDAGLSLPWVLAQQEVEYVNQMRFRRDPYQVTTAVTGVGGSSMTVASEITDPVDQTLISRARMALVDADGRPTRIPDAVRDGLAGHLVQD